MEGPFAKIGSNPAISSLITKIVDAIVTPLITFLFFLAMLVFVWGLFGLISKGDDPTARKEGQNHILWGVIGMFIMISAYGIVKVIGNTVGVDPFR
ncbi:MAG: hypothetical protein Q8Q03_01440 [bacterium]|nr:hypothetical protein [bacterium]